MLQKIGFILVCIGLMMADSDCLLIPFGVVSIGALLLWIETGREADDEAA